MRFPGYRLAICGALDVKPSAERLDFLGAWADCEGGTARFNAFNTTYRLIGSRNYNSAGVQHYQDALQGTAATLLTLRLPVYADLRAALTAEGLSATEIARRSSRGLAIWGTGNACILRRLSGQ
jgi:hypothetical protein